MAPNDTTGRVLNICPSFQHRPIADLIKSCDDCGDFAILCCQHPQKVCHHTRIVFTDGACLNNGSPLARSGVGIAMGTSSRSQISVPITNEIDDFEIRSNQRAELNAARMGLQYIAHNHQLNEGEEHRANRDGRDNDPCWVIATDSEYVVKGMTEWFPKWKVSKH